MLETLVASSLPALFRGAAQGIADHKITQDTKDILLFWLREEARYNLDILSSFRKDGKFDFNTGQAAHLGSLLRTEISALILSDPEKAKIMREALEKMPAGKGPNSVQGEDASIKNASDLVLWILRKMEVMKSLSTEPNIQDARFPKNYRFGVRTKHIHDKIRQLMKILEEHI